MKVVCIMERDPYLRKNDGLKSSSSSVSDNRWVDAMKNVPSFSEHMAKMNGNSSTDNAFSKATKASEKPDSNSNAFTKATKANENHANNSNAFTKASHSKNVQQPFFQNNHSKPIKR